MREEGKLMERRRKIRRDHQTLKRLIATVAVGCFLAATPYSVAAQESQPTPTPDQGTSLLLLLKGKEAEITGDLDCVPCCITAKSDPIYKGCWSCCGFQPLTKKDASDDTPTTTTIDIGPGGRDAGGDTP